MEVGEYANERVIGKRLKRQRQDRRLKAREAEREGQMGGADRSG